MLIIYKKLLFHNLTLKLYGNLPLPQISIVPQYHVGHSELILIIGNLDFKPPVLQGWLPHFNSGLKAYHLQG
jgi:hypothetical protein